jgi:hypothetical protein
MSNVHCQFSPTTIAIAAVQWAFGIHDIAWQAPLPTSLQRVPVWEHFRQTGTFQPSGVKEHISMEDVMGATLSFRPNAYE